MTTVTMSERELQDAVVEFAQARRWNVYHTFDSRRSTGKGFPDLILARRNRLLAVELKSDKGRLSPEQLTWLGAFADTGAETYVWFPTDWHGGLIEKVLL